MYELNKIFEANVKMYVFIKYSIFKKTNNNNNNNTT